MGLLELVRGRLFANVSSLWVHDPGFWMIYSLKKCSPSCICDHPWTEMVHLHSSDSCRKSPLASLSRMWWMKCLEEFALVSTTHGVYTQIFHLLHATQKEATPRISFKKKCRRVLFRLGGLPCLSHLHVDSRQEEGVFFLVTGRLSGHGPAFNKALLPFLDFGTSTQAKDFFPWRIFFYHDCILVLSSLTCLIILHNTCCRLLIFFRWFLEI